MPEILLLDTSPILAIGFRQFLKKHFGNAILHFSLKLSNLDFIKFAQPDLIILGTTKSILIDDIHLVYNVKRRFPQVPIIIFLDTRFGPTVIPFFLAEVSGIIPQNSNEISLAECIRSILLGKTYFFPQDCHDLHQIWLKNKELRSNHVFIRLSKREFEIATFLINGFKTGEIAKKLNRSTSTISTIKNNVFRKLNVTNIVKLQHLMTIHKPSDN
ncbi:LuxR C-terminal-related transcriptional regulator [Dyadobacter subterraneus]|uniref:Response regulator transcription factor n=1 Tax=Dyadobacter subterraneus TaxID=2773304 RepID=A0ABR9WRD6_9BACT|nr:response regulator transcription factor [Dyadobacter subterraneus]MBE9466654.1 response regulator transcription factor [Dyadobacter subterraneus]